MDESLWFSLIVEVTVCSDTAFVLVSNAEPSMRDTWTMDMRSFIETLDLTNAH